jgi:hypothetical protein
MSENWLKQPLFIQSFAPTSLVHVSKLTDSPKIFLIDDFSVRTQDTNQVQIMCSEVYTSSFCGEKRILLNQSRVTIIGYGLMDIWRYPILQFQVYQRKWILCLDMATSELLVLQQNRLTIWILLMLSLFLAVILGNHFRWLPCIY